jgi:hypothetical protein
MEDLYFVVGFVLASLGMPFAFDQFWWVFGGFIIFIMPILGKEADKHTKHDDSEFQID